MIEDLVARIFERIGHLWAVGGVPHKVTEDDVLKVLDEAAAVLYDSPIDTRLETGGLIIDKQSDGFDVFVYVGRYQ